MKVQVLLFEHGSGFDEGPTYLLMISTNDLLTKSLATSVLQATGEVWVEGLLDNETNGFCIVPS